MSNHRGAGSYATRAELVSLREEGGQQFATVKGFAGEQVNDALRLEPHGFASVPPAGAEGLLLTLGGRRPQPLLLGLEHPKHRPTLPAGAAALYDSHGNIIKLLGSAGAEVKLDGPFVLTLKEVTIVAERLVIACEDIRLGGEGGTKVMTQAGPAQFVRAV